MRFRLPDCQYMGGSRLTEIGKGAQDSSCIPYAPENDAKTDSDRRLAAGFADFVLYVFLLLPFIVADHNLFYLWTATMPFAFLSPVTPVGPISAYYWRRSAPPPAKANNGDTSPLIARRQLLQELANETVKVEAELQAALPTAGDLSAAFQDQIRQAQSSRVRILAEIARIDEELRILGVL